MDVRFGRRMRIVGTALAAALLAGVPAGAQPDYGLSTDSLEIADDAVRLPVYPASPTCHPFGMRVVRDSADVLSLQRWDGCAPSSFPALGQALYVRVVLAGDCHARHEVQAFRSASRREYRVVVVTRDGGCRSARSEWRWVRLPPLPRGWTVAIGRRRLERRD